MSTAGNKMTLKLFIERLACCNDMTLYNVEMNLRELIRDEMRRNLPSNIMFQKPLHPFFVDKEETAPEEPCERGNQDILANGPQIMAKPRTDEDYWRAIDFLGWNMHSDIDKLGQKLRETYTLNFIKELETFAKTKRKELADHMDDYAEKTVLGKRHYWGASDDGFWDLTAHIVGLGKDEYNECWKNPALAKARKNRREYKENFEYIFNH